MGHTLHPVGSALGPPASPSSPLFALPLSVRTGDLLRARRSPSPSVHRTRPPAVQHTIPRLARFSTPSCIALAPSPVTASLSTRCFILTTSRLPSLASSPMASVIASRGFRCLSCIATSLAGGPPSTPPSLSRPPSYLLPGPEVWTCSLHPSLASLPSLNTPPHLPPSLP